MISSTKFMLKNGLYFVWFGRWVHQQLPKVEKKLTMPFGAHIATRLACVVRRALDVRNSGNPVCLGHLRLWRLLPERNVSQSYEAAPKWNIDS